MNNLKIKIQQEQTDMYIQINIRAGIIISLWVLFSFLGMAQTPDMTQGFKYLETGNVKEGESFFAKILEVNPNNKTAKICYGRAVGLNGRPDVATQLFANLLIVYPDDLEVQLNYIESMLWGNRFDEAKPLYETLIKKYPYNFSALLGYANTLSNLKQYQEALKWINKAINIEPSNINAKISRKYITLGYANSFIPAQEYGKASSILHQVFNDFPEDKDVLLNLSNLYLIAQETDSALIIYEKLATSAIDSVKSLIGISLVHHISANNKEALNIAHLAHKKAQATNDTVVEKLALERLTQAYIWNKKYKIADATIDSIQNQYGNQNWVLALNATLGMYRSDFKESLMNYNAILANDSSSFDGNLGKANALFANAQIEEAYGAAYKTLEYYNQQKDALGFIKKLNDAHNVNLYQKGSYTSDNGDNKAFISQSKITVPFSGKLSTYVSYTYSNKSNTTTNSSANSDALNIGLSYLFSAKVKLDAWAGLYRSKTDEAHYTQPELEINWLLKPYKLQDLSLAYSRELQKFNADLIGEELIMNHYKMTYNMGTNINLGWYTQMMYTTQNDENKRKLLFSSIYYNLMSKPLLKTGINYQYLSFKNMVPSTYFSPGVYKALEIFFDSRGNLFPNTKYVSSFATGFQKVEQDDLSSLFRAEVRLEQKIHPRLTAEIYGLYSNVASATAAGFQFTDIGFTIRWMITEKPLFFKKLK